LFGGLDEGISLSLLFLLVCVSPDAQSSLSLGLVPHLHFRLKRDSFRFLREETHEEPGKHYTMHARSSGKGDIKRLFKKFQEKKILKRHKDTRDDPKKTLL
jgi:hypothetical protein